MDAQTIKEYQDKGVNIVNYDDILDNFWKHAFLVHLTMQDIQFLVNADCEGDALDYVMDYCVNVGWCGLYATPEDENVSDYDTDEFITAGNFCYKFTTYNIRIERI